ncbi:uncharacterized protein LOC105381566 isoform X2 [Plutella xylostella]|uniref:uncharacterized protein LOC105381566 isoform X2 n=1 Tax=Plutella xylostella TaxID=51655 RepID=UPI0020328F62|nr:uncharacterized protein LOC105381566 isoform X2 [Plutella xylostella]
MAAESGMFLFEVVVGSIQSFVESKNLIIRSEFAGLFSLELKDPSQLKIVMPEPLPLPVKGKKGKKGKKKKKKKKPKKKKKKGKKGKKGKKKKGAPEPPKPQIQAGQSVLLPSTAAVLLQTMRDEPLEVSVWSREELLVFIGAVSVKWDPQFHTYLQALLRCEDPPPVTVIETYNVRDVDSSKIMAQVELQIKLSYLKDRLTTSFRSLSDDLSMRKFLYTGLNNVTTSFMCTLKTSEEMYIENVGKIDETFTSEVKKIEYADYRNAPGTNLTNWDDAEGQMCCAGNTDPPPALEPSGLVQAPSIDFIIDYVRGVIASCNNDLRMLTPRPAIRPRHRAADLDRYCYCRERAWPPGDLARRFRQEAQSAPCPVCLDAAQKPGPRGGIFDMANLRGPCGRTECKVAREMRRYIENLVEQDNQEVDLEEIVGPCGSKDCTVAETIQSFLLQEGEFSKGGNTEGLSTQCGCFKRMQTILQRKTESSSESSSDESDEEDEKPAKPKSPGVTININNNRTYIVNYFTVLYDYMNHAVPNSPAPPSTEARSNEAGNDPSSGRVSSKSSKTKTPSDVQGSSSSSDSDVVGLRACGRACPSRLQYAATTDCSAAACSALVLEPPCPPAQPPKSPCVVCPGPAAPASPADSDVVIDFNKIESICQLKGCGVGEKVKELIADAMASHKNKDKSEERACICDCTCTFRFSKKTTFCSVCGGYECLGDDSRAQPAFLQPHPCPVYHKLYDKEKLQVKSPWPEPEKPPDSGAEKIVKEKQPLIKGNDSFANFSAVTVKTKKSKRKGKNDKKKPKDKKQPKIETKKDGSKNKDTESKGNKRKGGKRRKKLKAGPAKRRQARKRKTKKVGKQTKAKKKRTLSPKKKKNEPKPALVIKKHEGEYYVTMEVIKKYSKERLPFQYPYDNDKPPVVYRVGKTKEEIKRYQEKKERKERRETRRKRALLQSTFRDRCEDICLKAYNQAIGVLPLPNLNVPDCPCVTDSKIKIAEKDGADTPLECHEAPDGQVCGGGSTGSLHIKVKKPRAPCGQSDEAYATHGIGDIVDPNLTPTQHSCSCSDEEMSTSDSDGDSWIIEFTPPTARWDPKAKHPPVLTASESQYDFNDYRVKLTDKQGKPIPRFFIGPDGKRECSDLGGFWDSRQKWLEINKDGYIGPDNRWVPNNFIGPGGSHESSKEGTFTDKNGREWKIGIDGYIGKDNTWVWYSRRPRDTMSKTSTAIIPSTTKKPVVTKEEPKQLKQAVSKAGPKDKLDHQKTDKKVSKDPKVSKSQQKVQLPQQQKPQAQQQKVQGSKQQEQRPQRLTRPLIQPKGALHQPMQKEKAPQTPAKHVTYSDQANKKVALNASLSNVFDRDRPSYAPHRTTSKSAKLDQERIARYDEIMHDLDTSPHFEYNPNKTSRACNTTKKVSPFTLERTYSRSAQPRFVALRRPGVKAADTFSNSKTKFYQRKLKQVTATL